MSHIYHSLFNWYTQLIANINCNYLWSTIIKIHHHDITQHTYCHYYYFITDIILYFYFSPPLSFLLLQKLSFLAAYDGKQHRTACPWPKKKHSMTIIISKFTHRDEKKNKNKKNYKFKVPITKIKTINTTLLSPAPRIDSAITTTYPTILKFHPTGSGTHKRWYLHSEVPFNTSELKW